MFTTRPELVGTHGMVASTHWLASSAGMAVLESGVTEAIVQYVTSTRVMDTSGRRHAGVLSGDDLAAYSLHCRATTRAAVIPAT
jgi:gamma-glutamyltranspeptidase